MDRDDAWRERFERAVQALVDLALQEPMPVTCYVPVDWPQDDPRWRVVDVEPHWWQMEVPQHVIDEAHRRLYEMRRERLAALGLRRPQLASALGVSLRELEEGFGL